MGLQHFLNLPPEQQERILRAGLAEFIAHGFDLASTNRIVEQAGISKGVLFKYFTDKEGLFLYLCRRSAEVVVRGYDEVLPHLPADFWAALKALTWHELSLRQAHPEEYAFMELVVANPLHPVYRQGLGLFQAKAAEIYAHLMGAVSQSGLRQDVPFEKVMALIGWVADGIKRQFQAAGVIDRETVMAELDTYLDLLKSGLQN